MDLFHPFIRVPAVAVEVAEVHARIDVPSRLDLGKNSVECVEVGPDVERRA